MRSVPDGWSGRVRTAAAPQARAAAAKLPDIEAGDALVKPDISAPGMGVSSLLRPNNYSQTNWNGTSMACPHAAGVAALMLSKNPTLTPADLARILSQTSVDLGAPGKDNVFGAGRIDAEAALAAVPQAQVASVVVSDATILDANGAEMRYEYDAAGNRVDGEFVINTETSSTQDLPALALYYTDRVVVYNADIFDNWYYTPGGYGGGVPMPYNKHQFIVGVPEGLAIRGTE